MEHCRKAHHSELFKKNLITRLNRINGQINGVKAMIEHDTYCDNVLNLITGIRSALAAVQRILLEEHITSCVVEQIHKGNDAVIDELLETVRRMVR